jgi:RNA polymerase sigma-70 factor, ECF subfamily
MSLILRKSACLFSAPDSGNVQLTPREAEEFAALWAKDNARIAAFVRSLTPNFQQAEEILQRVAVTLVRKFDQYDRGRPFAAWAIGIARNEVLYFRRQWATRRHLFDDELLGQLAASYQRLAEQEDPAEMALPGCLEELAGRARHAVRLRYVSNLSSKRIAEDMHLSAGAVRMLLARARTRLRECIERKAMSQELRDG